MIQRFNEGDTVMNCFSASSGNARVEKVSRNLVYIRYDQDPMNAHWVAIEGLKSVQVQTGELRRVNPDGTLFQEATQTNPEPTSFFYCDKDGNPKNYDFGETLKK